MSDAPRPADSIEQRLGLVARGVQRMADAFGSLEQRLTDLADAEGLRALSDRTDEYRVRSRAEVAQLAEKLERLESETNRAIDLIRSVGTSLDAGPSRPAWVDELTERMRILERRIAEQPSATSTPGTDPAVTERLVEAVRGLRDDIAVAVGELRVETIAAIERVITEQNSRLTRLHEAIGMARADPSTARLEDVQRVLDEVRDELRAVHGEFVTNAGQLRTDLAADAASQRDRVVEAIKSAPIAEDRFAAIEDVIASLRDELAIDRLETSLRDVAQDTSGLRADVRRSFDRVLHEIGTTEESLKGEVRAVDHRLAGMGDDLRIVRQLRDGLEALASGIDGVRQLASRSATSAQMGELARDLSTVLAEIETARAQVINVDQQQPPAIDVRAVTDEMADLGARIEALADRAVTAAPASSDDPMAARLRTLATSARQLSMGIAEDLKARRKRARKPVHER
jgi:hypothetical protein